jgi:DNA repair protein RadB
VDECTLPLNCASLDQLLGGGLECGIITEIHGEGGSGKTNICLQAACNCAVQGEKVAYVDTEGVSEKRLSQICGGSTEVTKKILFFQPYSMEEQEHMVEKAIKIEAGLIVVDSVNLYYRLDMNGDEGAATRSLSRQLVTLQIAARKRDIPVVVTSQVYAMDGQIRPFGGRSIDHMVKTALCLHKVDEQRDDGTETRLAELLKHRAKPSGEKVSFQITQAGLA